MRISPRLWLLLLCSALVLLSAGARVSAAPPAAPQSVKAELILLAGTTEQHVLLSWLENRSEGRTDGYRIFVARNNAAEFTLFGESLLTTWQAGPLAPGFYQFHVRAYNKEGQSPPSAVVNVDVGDLDDPDSPSPLIEFTSTPETEARQGDVYRTEIRALSKVAGTLSYELRQGPQGMLLDPISGAIEWRPADPGAFTVRVRAWLSTARPLWAEQEWRIAVAPRDDDPGDPGQPCAELRGQVVGPSGDLLQIGILTLIRVDGSESDSFNSESGDLLSRTIQKGQFEILVPAGRYVAFVSGPGISETWYGGGQDVRQARRFTLECGSVHNMSLIARKRSLRGQRTLSGQTVDALSGEPVAGTIFFSVAPGINISPDFWDNHLPYPSEYIRTDFDGNFSITLPEGIPFVAEALPFIADNSQYPDVEGHQSRYYGGTADPAEALRLPEGMSSAPLRIELPTLPQIDNVLRGSVVAGSDRQGQPARIRLLRLVVDANGQMRIDARSTGSDIAGRFEIFNLEPGDYLIQAIPFGKTFLPSYATRDGNPALHWQEARLLHVEASGRILEDLQIALPLNAGLLGRTGIQGRVERTQHNGVSSAIAGAILYAIKNDGSVADFTISDQTGAFDFRWLSAGRYTILVDKPGFEILTESISLDYESRVFVNRRFVLQDLNASTTDVQTLGADFPSVLVSPNPARHSARCIFTSPTSGSIQFRLIDSRGREVFSDEIVAIAGPNTYIIDTSLFAAGIYIARFSGIRFTTSAFLLIAH